jgi:hypothetical protein
LEFFLFGGIGTLRLNLRPQKKSLWKFLKKWSTNGCGPVFNADLSGVLFLYNVADNMDRNQILPTK